MPNDSIREVRASNASPSPLDAARHSSDETQSLLDLLAETRRLVATAALSGFTDEDAVMALFVNNGAISRALSAAPASAPSQGNSSANASLRPTPKSADTEAEPSGAWRPIETAPFTYDTTFDPPTKWLSWCLLGRFDHHGWIEWVGGMDADMWLLRDDERCCGDCAAPSHWAPLPSPPRAAAGPAIGPSHRLEDQENQSVTTPPATEGEGT